MIVKVMGEWAQLTGQREVILEPSPRNIRQLFKMLEEKYPCGKWKHSTVALNHVLYNGDYTKTITNEDVCILPTIEGG